ncbi:MAG: peptide ABC transporter substrate-binding protein [Chloroflexota bacterium]|nr:ABC transporter substrate-binding protein [Chloroflexota bacterium]NOG64714.1 ABC transporter substrate-binding protein [Chloroflexota bacterium]GIK66287.1 MAG: peptide ABC transporter substrate-binding protein [Chloroflexota bacterium]
MLLNRKLLAVALCIAVCVMALPRHPISVSHAQDSTITIGTTDLPLTLDPAEATTYVSWEVLSHIYTGLTRQIPDSTDYELAVAATHTVSEDGLTHTFTIRDDATFTDGTPITADTFAYSINRVITLDEEAFDLLDGIVTSVSVDENGALVFQLTRPIPYFLGLVSLPPFFAVKESDFPANNLNQFPTTLTGNGVYLFDSWNPGDSITLKANPDFQYGPVAKTDTIVLRRYISSFELSQALETRAIDLVWRDMLLPDAIETAQNNASFRLEHVPSARMWYVYMVRRFDYMDDPVVRESFLLGINRERVTQEYFQGYLTPAYSLVPALFSDAYNPLWQTTPDATLIDRKLRDAGYREANISRAQINLITSQSVYGDYYVDALNDLTKDFIPVRVIAINITTGQNLEQRGVFAEAVQHGDAPTSVFALSPVIAHPDYYLRALLHSNGLLARGGEFGNADIDALLNQAALETDPTVQAELYRQAQTLIQPENIIAPLWEDTLTVLTWNDIGGITIEPNFFLHYDLLTREQ